MTRADKQKHAIVVAVLLALTVVFGVVNQNKFNAEKELNYPQLQFLNVADSLDVSILRLGLESHFSEKKAAEVEAAVRADHGKRQTAFGRNFVPLDVSSVLYIGKRGLFFGGVFFVCWLGMLLLAERLAVYAFLKQPKKSRVWGVYLWKRAKRVNEWKLHSLVFFRALARQIAAGIRTVILFSPAFVLAYMFKNELESFRAVSYVLLIICSNGVLVLLVERFRAILRRESRQNYVLTAQIKGLSPLLIGSISRFQFLKDYRTVLGKRTVFFHVFLNAKEQILELGRAFIPFFMSVMIIVEMALNAQGYFGYYLLKMLLFGNTHIVLLQLLVLYGIAAGAERVVSQRKARLEELGK